MLKTLDSCLSMRLQSSYDSLLLRQTAADAAVPRTWSQWTACLPPSFCQHQITLLGGRWGSNLAKISVEQHSGWESCDCKHESTAYCCIINSLQCGICSILLYATSRSTVQVTEKLDQTVRFWATFWISYYQWRHVGQVEGCSRSWSGVAPLCR